MLRKHLEAVCKELAIEMPKQNKEKQFAVAIGTDLVIIHELDPGIAFHAKIREVPTQNKEELFMYLMRANLLGQGTGNSRIGLSEEEKFLTLSLGLPYETNYQDFKDSLEYFLNYLQYFRDEVTRFEKTENIY